MNGKLVIGFLLALFALSIVACSTPSSGTTATTTTAPSSGGTVEQKPAVSIENYVFNPAVLTIAAGTTVVWTNNDTALHDIKSADFSSDKLAQGETFEFKFETAGTYDYSCGIHPTMTGKIIVK